MFTKANLIIAGILVAALLGVLGLIKYQGNKIDSLENTVKTQKKSLDDLSSTVELKIKSGAITEQTHAETIRKEEIVKEVMGKVQSELDRQEEEIESRYGSNPSPEQGEKKSDELSTVRIRSLWKSWCTNTEQWTKPECKEFKPG